MIHWHKWAEESRQLGNIAKMRVPLLVATHEDYDTAQWPREAGTMFLFRCSKCQAVKVTEVKGHWAK